MGAAFKALHMRLYCYKCSLTGFLNHDRSSYEGHGSYYRTSDKKYVIRYRCKRCRGTFSNARFNSFYRQKKRQHNEAIYKALASTDSQRRVAKNLKINRKTVVRAFRLLSDISEAKFHDDNAFVAKATSIQFDDLETIEHTKCKPVSVTMAVDSDTGRILDLEISKMPAKGRLAERSCLKYGYRSDERQANRKRMFARMQNLIHSYAEIKSDSDPYYPAVVREFFPLAEHKQFLSRKPSDVGQGEWKKGANDPLRRINHAFARARADVNRLIRRTWCTTKSVPELRRHLFLFARYHNENLTPPKTNTLRGQFTIKS